MVETTNPNGEYNITDDNFRKIFHHICLAAKKQSKVDKKLKEFSIAEKNILTKKIDELEHKTPNNSTSWITKKLETKVPVTPKKVVVVRPKVENAKSKELDKLKAYVAEVKRNYNMLKNNKTIDKEKLRTLQRRLEALENVLKENSK